MNRPGGKSSRLPGPVSGSWRSKFGRFAATGPESPRTDFVDPFAVPILGALLVCTLPHFINVSLWVTAACLVLWGYILLAVRYHRPLPAKIYLRIMAGLFFVGSMTTHEGFTIEAFVALLALMITLKILEIKHAQDRSLTVILCYFLIIGGLFFGDTIEDTLYKVFSVVYTTAVLIQVNRLERQGPSPVKLALLLMGQALPIMLVLFLLFPRIPGGLFGRTHADSASTGFSDEVAFGSIASLAQNKAVAFRVEFDGQVPARQLLYWRGVVLWNFDGTIWRRGIGRHTMPARSLKGEEAVNYTITLEPHDKRWLFTLDLPRKIDLPLSFRQIDYSYYSWRPVNRRVVYKGLSYLDSRDNNLVEGNRAHAQQLPAEGNPRARKLAETMMGDTSSQEDLIRRGLAFFRQGKFIYTLNPPLLKRAGEEDESNQIDRFLFETRSGFCEHYAASFAFLMRAAGLPTRLVAGYQGGEINKYGDYLVLRQSDAHVWCEVWVDGQGWLRIDPTGEVAPERLSANAEKALTPGERARFLALPEMGGFGEWLGSLQSYWDFINSRWNRVVIGYSFNEQSGLFSRFGFSFRGWQGFGAAVFSALSSVVLLIFIVGLFMHRKPAAVRDEAAESWIIFCRKLAEVGLPRKAAQGPLDFKNHIVLKRPDLAAEVEEIVAVYVRLRYASNAEDEDLSLLKSKVRQFSPATSR